jgi:UDP-GlcNAc:undecaprenyl-phosphate GlcNAc-1-phosphate transferase
MITKAAILIFIISIALSATLTAIIRKLAPCLGLVAHPTADRYHRTIVPLGGGIAIFSTLAIAILTAIAAAKFLVAAGHFHRLAEAANVTTADFFNRIDELVLILLSASVLFALGLWDDKKHLGPFFKLAVQFIVAIMAAALAKIRVDFFIQNEIVTSLLSAFWIVLIINAFNFLDNMDGASAGIATITSSILFIAAVLSGQVFVGGLALIFIGVLLGFLLFNFPPAKIFMGDAGSLVVGFFVAILTVRTTYYHQAQSGQWYPVLMPLVVMAVPLYDFISVTLLRISQGKSPFVGDTQHFSHRLRKRGLTDTQTVLTLYLATFCTGLSAIFLYQVNLTGAILILIQTVMVLGIIAILESVTLKDRTPD